MKLEYFGHSCFRMTFSSSARIVTDPYGDIGYRLPRIEAEIVTVSHGHYDHCNAQAVGGSPAVLSAPVSCEMRGVKISTLGSFHDDAGGRKRGKNLIFRFEADGLTVCHLGDIGERLNAASEAWLSSADVLLLPVGGNYTIGAREAAEYVERLSPKIVVPMHFFTPGLQVDISGADEFLSLFPPSSVERCGGTVELGGASVAKQSKKILFMERIGYGE